ncbi:MAG TPA: hypothetical protein VF794_36315 [Archangium sp.]|uniref:hypothetical protein n=1 Tax=Archangium sp. TaxID=1872627 RepID=UPI002ED94A67
MNALLTALVLAASPEAPRTETPAPHRAFWVQPFVQPKLLTNFSYEPEYGYDLTDQPGGASEEVGKAAPGSCGGFITAARPFRKAPAGERPAIPRASGGGLKPFRFR